MVRLPPEVAEIALFDWLLRLLKNEMKWVTPTRIPLEDKINKHTMLFILLVPLLMVAKRMNLISVTESLL